MNCVFECNICSATVLELSHSGHVASLQHYECNCPGCGAMGHFQVDADEDGTRAQWIGRAAVEDVA